MIQLIGRYRPKPQYTGMYQLLDMSRSWHVTIPNVELKMALSTANGQKSWLNLGPVTIVTISWHDFPFEHTPNKKTWADPELDQVKMALSTANGLKSRCILVDRSLAKQPPRGPFAHELRNQTGGNNYVRSQIRDIIVTNNKSHDTVELGSSYREKHGNRHNIHCARVLRHFILKNGFSVYDMRIHWMSIYIKLLHIF